MSLVLWADDLNRKIPEGAAGLPFRVLLVLGLTGAGAVLAGLAVQLLSKGMARATAPPPAVNLVRVAGAVAGGLAGILWLFGTGGGGVGFGTGTGTGPGTENTSTNKDKSATTDKKTREDEKKDDKKTTGPMIDPNDILYIEVLGNKSLLKAPEPDQKADEIPRYRLQMAEGKKESIALKELKNWLRDHDPKPRQVILLSYRDDSGDSDITSARRVLVEVARTLNKNPETWIDVKPAPEDRPIPDR